MERGSAAEVVVGGPDGPIRTITLTGRRVTVGRLPGVNDIALGPDPELLVTRAAHCTFEREGSSWLVVDGGSVNGTFLRRGGELGQVAGRTPLREGDVVCVLASVAGGERRFFELAFHEAQDSQATRATAPVGSPDCLTYDTDEGRLLLLRDGNGREIQLRPQGHRLVRYLAARNAESGSPVLCTHEELMQAVWGDEPMHTREELAKLFWELRRRLEPLGAAELIESERGRGYRLRTCPHP